MTLVSGGTSTLVVFCDHLGDGVSLDILEDYPGEVRVLNPIGDNSRRVSNGIEKFLRHYNQICDSGIYPSLDWASSSDGLSNRCYKPPHGDAGATCESRNVGSNKVFVNGVSECLRLRGQPTRMGMWGLRVKIGMWGVIRFMYPGYPNAWDCAANTPPAWGCGGYV